jgi:protocatechuate 3,4-dioxygenase beta subunit
VNKRIIVAEPKIFHVPIDRRRFFKSMAIASAGFTLPGYLAEALTIAPSVTQGPYYPTPATMPLEKDNDLIYLNDNLVRAVGKITYLTGRVLTASGSPISGALVELWHADNSGKYVFQKNDVNSTYDTNFQGFGQFLTGKSGAYKFRTIKAGLYNGRVRHYHMSARETNMNPGHKKSRQDPKIRPSLCIIVPLGGNSPAPCSLRSPWLSSCG